MIMIGSCQKDASRRIVEGDTQVTLTMNVPSKIATRALSEAEHTDIVFYEIWTSDWQRKLYPVDDLASEAVNDGRASINLTLVTNQTYNFIFWAQNKNCGAYDVTNLKKVSVDYSVIAPYVESNQDLFDAFYAVKIFNVTGPLKDTVALHRPFVQLNFGATRMSTSFGPLHVDSTKVTVSSLATTFNTIEGIGEDPTDSPVTFKAVGMPTTDSLSTNQNKYTWVTMDYMLMNGDHDAVDVIGEFYVGMPSPIVHEVPQASIKRNYRTNIVGDLFTTDATLTVVVDERFLGDFVGDLEGDFEQIDNPLID